MNFNKNVFMDTCRKHGLRKSTILRKLKEGKTMDDIIPVVIDLPYELTGMILTYIRCDVFAMSQKEFAELLTEWTNHEYGVPMVTATETGRRTYNLRTLKIICVMSGKSMDYVLGRSDNEAAYPKADNMDMSYADRLRCIMERRHMDISALRGELRTKGFQRARIECPGVDTLKTIADILNCSTDYLVGLTDVISGN